MYEELIARSAANGFAQYEVANFARGGFEFDPDLRDSLPKWACRHNVNYWRAGDYYGLGPSAAGYVRGQRTKNWPNTILYCEQLEKGRRAIESTEELTPLRRAGETAAFGLRMNSGWPLAEFERVTGYELKTEWRPEIEELVSQNWARLESDRFQLTPEGLRRADYAAELFLR
jgi:oxygen-independent coproporphyrinogen-3 oxidase